MFNNVNAFFNNSFKWDDRTGLVEMNLHSQGGSTNVVYSLIEEKIIRITHDDAIVKQSKEDFLNQYNDYICLYIINSNHKNLCLDEYFIKGYPIDNIIIAINSNNKFYLFVMSIDSPLFEHIILTEQEFDIFKQKIPHIIDFISEKDNVIITTKIQVKRRKLSYHNYDWEFVWYDNDIICIKIDNFKNIYSLKEKEVIDGFTWTIENINDVYNMDYIWIKNMNEEYMSIDDIISTDDQKFVYSDQNKVFIIEYLNEKFIFAIKDEKLYVELIDDEKLNKIIKNNAGYIIDGNVIKKQNGGGSQNELV